MKSSLIVFGEDWGRHPSSTQHIIRRLASSRHVLWVNSIGMRRPRLSLGDAARVAAKLTAARSAPSPKGETPERLSVASPLAMPAPRSALFQAINGRLISRQLRSTVLSERFRSSVLWLSLPTAWPVVDQLPHDALVYYCGDDFGSIADVDHATALALERRVADRADLIITVSNKLFERFPSHKTVFVPHGVDVEVFSRPVPRAADLPVGRPTAGYYGLLQDWIDFDMLVSAIESLPDWDFVFIGKPVVDVSRLARLSNVRLLGPRPHAALASYAQHWDVSLVPFKDIESIRHSNPLKIREYLAAGSPIASVGFPAIDEFRSLISIADGPGDFANAIRRAATDRGRNELRKASVAAQSWDARAQEVSGLLDGLPMKRDARGS